MARPQKAEAPMAGRSERHSHGGDDMGSARLRCEMVRMPRVPFMRYAWLPRVAVAQWHFALLDFFAGYGGSVSPLGYSCGSLMVMGDQPIAPSQDARLRRFCALVGRGGIEPPTTRLRIESSTNFELTAPSFYSRLSGKPSSSTSWAFPPAIASVNALRAWAKSAAMAPACSNETTRSATVVSLERSVFSPPLT